MALNIERLTLYKHGLGFFERGGAAEASFTLEFPRRAMDDVLKSLTVLPATATISGVAFETPPDRNPEAQRQPLYLNADRPLSSLIDAFVGRQVVVSIGDKRVEGALIGLEREHEEHLKRAVLAVQTSLGIRLLPLDDVSTIAFADDSAEGDLSFALETKRRNEERSYARVTLSNESDVQVNYIAPAPAWRVSYRVITSAANSSTASSPDSTAPVPSPDSTAPVPSPDSTAPVPSPDSTAPVPSPDSEARDVFIQGWGIFDNTLEEDLENVQLTLTAGMPVSFRFGLHQPTTPQRPTIEEDNRVISAPMEFASLSASGANYDSIEMESAAPMPMVAAAPMMKRGRSQLSAATLGESAPTQATGDARAALFAYRIDAPVNVRRGESGMVPILTVKTRGQRELLYNSNKNPKHPASSVRFTNGDLTLERGPATVLDNGEYAGEAIIPFTTGGTEVILAFALELGISVSSQMSSHEETRSVTVRDGSLFLGAVEYIETTYTIASQLAERCVVTIEHPRQYNAELETVPVESSVSEARFTCPVSARATVEFVVVEKRDRSRYEYVRGVDGDRLGNFLNNRLIDRKLFDELSEILATQATIFSIEQATVQREADRGKIRERMDDTRQNLSTLDAKDDSSLRKRFIKQLEAFDDEMLAFDKQDQASLQEVARLETLIANELQRLSASTK